MDSLSNFVNDGEIVIAGLGQYTYCPFKGLSTKNVKLEAIVLMSHFDETNNWKMLHRKQMPSSRYYLFMNLCTINIIFFYLNWQFFDFFS